MQSRKSTSGLCMQAAMEPTKRPPHSVHQLWGVVPPKVPAKNAKKRENKEAGGAIAASEKSEGRKEEKSKDEPPP